VSPSPEECANFVSGVNPSSDRQRHKDTLRRTVDYVNDDLALFMRGGNIEKNQFIGTLLIVDLGGLHGVAGVAQVEEVDPLHNSAIFDIETGNDAFGEHSFSLLLHRSTRLLVCETLLIQGLADEYPIYPKRFERRQLPQIV